MVSIATLLVWRIMVVTLAEHYAGPLNRTIQDPVRTLAWYSNHPKALYHLALSQIKSGHGQAEKYLRQALQQEPSNGKLLAKLAIVLANKGRKKEADIALELAFQMYPRHAIVNRQAAMHWLTQGRSDRMVMHWKRVLRGRPRLESKVFPVLLSFLENPSLKKTFSYLIKSPPEWWERFFVYVSHNGSVTALHTLYQLRVAKGSLSKTAMGVYLRRLQREKLWTRAYLAWVAQLDPQETKLLGYLYNGSFEKDFSNQAFGWHIPEVSGIFVRVVPKQDRTLNGVLEIVLNNLPIRSEFLFQPIHLPSGIYQFMGVFSSTKLRGGSALFWLVQCATSYPKTLGRSDPIEGTQEWTKFSFSFEVPSTGCHNQKIQLGAEGIRSHLGRIQGLARFDTLQIISGGE